MIPAPRKYDNFPGSFRIGEDLAAILSDPVLSMAGSDVPGIAFCRAEPGQMEGEESYILEISGEGIKITAEGEKGIFNGLLSLSFLFKAQGFNLECCRIEDAPVFKNRAVMLDISRNRVYKMDYLKQMVRKFTLLKFNQLQLYMENTFDYRGHETACRNASPLTAEEIRELDQFCSERGIVVVPNQNSFGHMERWLKHPEYHDLAEAPEGFEDSWGVFRPESSTLYPGTSKSMEFIRGLYDQLLPNFTSRRFNIGCDETFDLGKGRSRMRAEEEGTGAVYLDFVNQLINEVEGRGFYVQIWADIILNYPELLPSLAGNVTVVNWGYEPDHPFEKETAVLKGSGLDFYVCTGTSSWNTPAARWEGAFENIRNGAFWAEKNGASGFMVTDWGDNGHWNQPVASWPGFLMASQAAWGGSGSMSESVTEKGLEVFIYGSIPAARAHRILASLYLESPHVLHNGSIFTYLMMDPFYPYYRGEYEACRKGGCGRASDLVITAGELIAEAAREGDYPYRSELELMHSHCRFSVNLTCSLFQTGGTDWTAMGNEDRESLKDELNKLSDQFASVWPLSCRPGGLEDSLDKLRSWMPRLEMRG